MSDMSEREKRVLQLWEEAGRPKGRDQEFWRQAEREIDGEAQ